MPVQYRPEAEYRRLAEAAEDAEAAAFIDRFRERPAAGDEDLVPAEVVKRLLAGDNPVHVWREHRRLKSGDLAAMANLSQAYISQIEGGKREGSLAAMKANAETLRVTIDDLI